MRKVTIWPVVALIIVIGAGVLSQSLFVVRERATSDHLAIRRTHPYDSRAGVALAHALYPDAGLL